MFKKGFVKIRVHTDQAASRRAEEKPASFTEDDEDEDPIKSGEQFKQAVFGDPEPKDDFERSIKAFIEKMIELMGYSATASMSFREEKKLGIRIDSEQSSVIIGKKGKNLDAIQLLANIYAGRVVKEHIRVILDSENYRIRREESLVRLAYTVADKVRETKNSVLLEPMNPFDRRLIHTTLNDISEVETKSEGEGLYKQVRVYYKR